MARRVPLARRNLFQDRRRATLSVLGVAGALVLVLVLNGVYAGAMRQVTSYIDDSPAGAFVSQSGVRTMHMSATSLPGDTIVRVRGVEGVAWAEPLRYTTGLVSAGSGSDIAYVFGYDPATRHAGPRRMVAGRAPRAKEVVVDKAAADELGIKIGDTVQVLGSPLRVSGLAIGGTNIVNTTVFITADEFTRLRGPGLNYVLVAAKAGIDDAELARRVSEAVPGSTVQTRQQFSSQEAMIVRDMAADIMNVMTLVGFLIALAVVALTLFTVTLSKLREYGVVKALGATGALLVRTVIVQATWTVMLATLFAVIVTGLLGVAVGALTPNIRVVVEPATVIRVATGALFVGGLAALVPVRRVLTVDPASAFRRPS